MLLHTTLTVVNLAVVARVLSHDVDNKRKAPTPSPLDTSPYLPVSAKAHNCLPPLNVPAVCIRNPDSCTKSLKNSKHSAGCTGLYLLLTTDNGSLVSLL